MNTFEIVSSAKGIRRFKVFRSLSYTTTGPKDYRQSGGNFMSNNVGWYYARGQQQVGPMSLDELIGQIHNAGGERSLVYGPGMSAWAEARDVPAIAERLRGRSGSTPPPVPPGRSYGSSARGHDQIDYEIHGAEMQYVEVILDPGEMAIADAGSMFYMTPSIEMNTVFGDPSQSSQGQGGLFGKLMTAGKRVLTGESLFITTFTNAHPSEQHRIAFAAPYPGKIVAVDLNDYGGELICQKHSFLAAARGVSINIAFQKKIGVALFGGEGFIMQRLSGAGMAFVHAGGTLVKRTLAPGETLRLDTGCLVALAKTVNYDIQMVGGIKNALFGGEGLFFATLTGPGDVWLQSLPLSRLAGRIWAAAPQTGGRGKEEGSVLGALGGLLDGDNS
jgi:uncharacterized protein (TIGR00266 family)